MSDTCSNSIRVIKTTRQTATVPMTYPQVVRVRDLGLLADGVKFGVFLARSSEGWTFGIDVPGTQDKDHDKRNARHHVHRLMEVGNGLVGQTKNLNTPKNAFFKQTRLPHTI